MKVQLLNNRDEIIQNTVSLIIDRVSSTTDTFVLGLSTGVTVLSICQELAKYAQLHNVSFKHVHIFYAGEYIGYSQQNRHSYTQLLWQDFFNNIELNHDNIHTLSGEVSDLELECESFEQKIDALGGIDLFVGSLGSVGEIAFNEPGSSLKSRTRLKTLTKDTITADARFFDNDINLVPKQALTMGLNTIYHAKEVAIVVYGTHKAFVVRDALEKPISDMHPASVFQTHPNVRFIIDKVAGRLLSSFLRLEINNM